MSKDEANLFGISKNIGGYFNNNLDKNIIYLRYYKKTQYMISTILHEYVHYVHAQRQASFPRWFEEGTAEYLSGVEIGNDKLILGAIQKGRLAWLGYEKWLPAKSIINPGEMADWTGTDLSMFYAQSWLITFYLNNRELPQWQSYSTQLNNYINALNNGENKITAFESAFDLKIDKVNRALKTYWKRGKFKKLALNKSILLKGVHIESKPLTQGEINLMLGKFSYSREQTKQSLFYFDKASNFEAQRDNALIGKAKTHIVNESYDEARTLLKKVDIKNADLSELHFSKAQLNHALGEESDDSKTKIDLANKALKELVSAWKLDKTNAKIYYFYGLISLKYDLDKDRAVSMLDEAIYHNPSNIGLKVMLFRAKILTGHKQSYEYGQKLLASFNSEYHLSAVDELNDLIEISAHFQKYKNEDNFKSWAISQNGDYGYSYGFSNQIDADKAAIKYCISDRKDANDCQVIERENGNSQAFKTWFKLQILDDV
jgi:Tfp pilus assembly protein PilF